MSKIKSWSYLNAGDIVDIIAPASHSPIDKLQEGAEWLSSYGLIPRIPKNIIKRDVFFAAPLEIQLEHLMDALYSDSKAIWCLRGGYGSMRLIPHLLKLRPPKKPKIFIGFSDITALHLFFNQHWKWPTIHGRTISQLSLQNHKTPDRKFHKSIIFGEETSKTFNRLKALNTYAKEEQTINGVITGGNLRILQSSLGTSWELQAKNKILFIEDVAERGYSIDRMLEQMIQAKIIHKGLKALIFGDFTEGHEKDGKDFVPIALKRFADRVPYPVLRGLPAGHGHKLNYPIPFNTPTELITGKICKLTCTYSGDL